MSIAATAPVTELDLEAALPAAIDKAFQGALGIDHQIEFSIQLGENKLTKNGEKSWAARGRADVVLEFKGQPLAIFELKKPGRPLEAKDEAQGLSYARLLVPRMAPLVVVTNGQEVRMLDAYTGQRWESETINEAAFAVLLTNTAKVAGGDRKRAIETLMGQDAEIWTQGVGAAAKAALAAISADAQNPPRPLGVLRIPREATATILDHLHQDRFVVLAGPPLAGKTNVLAELIHTLNEEDSGAALYIERGRGTITRRVADILTRALDWPVTPEEAREWLRRLSHAEGPRLVLAIDDVNPDDDASVVELEDLTSTVFGPRLAVVVTVDEGAKTRLLQGSKGYGQSPLGRDAKTVEVGALSTQEYHQARSKLFDLKMGIMEGGEFSSELRRPWFLQAQVSRLAKIPGVGVGMLPAVPGLEVLTQTRAAFPDPELRRRYRALARAIIFDAQDQSRPPGMEFELLSRFFIRRDTVDNHLRPDDVNWLMSRGFIVPTIGEADVPIVTVGLAELLASELSLALADGLAPLVDVDASHAAEWLAGAASNFMLGDVIAAQAMFDLADRSAPSFKLIGALAKMTPKRRRLQAAKTYRSWTPSQSVAEARFVAGDLAPYDGIHGWLVLSHLAERRSQVDIGNGPERLDRHILMTTGRADFILRQPSYDLEFDRLPVHERDDGGQLVCHHAGIVEPVTTHMFTYLRREPRVEADSFVDEALDENDVYLLARLDIALRTLARASDAGLAGWAKTTLANKVRPALKGLLSDH